MKTDLLAYSCGVLHVSQIDRWWSKLRYADKVKLFAATRKLGWKNDHHPRTEHKSIWDLI